MNYYQVAENKKKEFLSQLPVSQERNKILCSLLAAENISIVYKNVKTASFDTINRVLVIPQWNDISVSIIDRIIIHEVGHALFTEDWSELMAPLSGIARKASNIVEDRRIDNAMRKTYPGVAKDYAAAGKEIVAKNIWDIQKISFNTLGFFDRANMLSKVGHSKELINFSAQEKGWLKEIENAQSTKEAVDLAVRILNELKEQKKEEKPEEGEEKVEEKVEEKPDEKDPGEEQGEDFEEAEEEKDPEEEQGEDFEEVEEEEGEGSKSETPEKNTEEDDGASSEGNGSDEAAAEEEEILSSDIFEDIQGDLDTVKNNQSINHYLDMPINPKNYIITLDTLMRQGNIKKHDLEYCNFSKENRVSIKKDAAQLFKEFSVRKEANVHNTFFTDRGTLDMNRLAEYKTNDQIFTRTVKRVANAQNHKFYFLIDYSGSMTGQNIVFAARQASVFKEFCQMAKAEYEIYLFTTGTSKLGPDRDSYKAVLAIDNGRKQYFVGSVQLLEIANNNQSEQDFYNIMHCTTRHMLADYHMGGTPSTHAVKLIRTLIEKEKAAFPDKKINFVMLTDGEEGSQLGNNCIFESQDRVHYSTAGSSYLAQLKMLKKSCHSILGFTIGTARTIYDNIKACDNPDNKSFSEMHHDFKNELIKNHYLKLPLDGFDDFYVLKNTREGSLEDELSNIDSDASYKKFSATFIKSQKSAMVQKEITKKISEKIS